MVINTARVLVVLAVLLSLTMPAMAADEVELLSQRLIELRGQVDDLNAELELTRESSHQKIKMLAEQRFELEGRVNREALKQQRLRATLEKNRKLAAEAGSDESQLTPVLNRAMDELEVVITQGLPFKSAERLMALEEIRNKLKAGVVSPSRTANRLWAFCEDELGLTREIGIYRQSIDLNGEIILADVAKLGMVMLYFRTPDQRHGMARKQGDGWHFQLVEEKQQPQVADLFDALDKQVRTGLFELPNAI